MPKNPTLADNQDPIINRADNAKKIQPTHYSPLVNESEPKAIGKVSSSFKTLPQAINTSTSNTQTQPKTENDNSSGMQLPKVVAGVNINKILSVTPVIQSMPTIQSASDSALTSVTSGDIEKIIKSGDNTIIVKTDKDVYVNTYEQITEQKYITAGGSGGTPGGNNEQVQFNLSGTFAGSSGLTYNSGTNTLTADNLTVNGTTLLGAVSNVSITGGTSGQVLCTNGSGVLNWATVSGGGVSPATPTSLGTVFGYTTGNGNTSIGYCAGNTTQGGSENTAIGRFSLQFSTSGSYNIAIGYGTLSQNQCDGNIAIGSFAASCNTIGCGNVALGDTALYANVCGKNNVAIGKIALGSSTGGDNNVSIGYGSLSWYCGDYLGAGNNVAIGACAMYCSLCGGSNIALGLNTLSNNKGSLNIALGENSLYNNSTGTNNIGIGAEALFNNGTGYRNIAIGFRAQACSSNSYGNISLGTDSLCKNTGNENMAVGTGALRCNTSGFNNIGLGAGSGSAITTGSNNTVIGSLNGNPGLVCTVLIGAGTCERIKVDNSGLYINNSLFPNSLYDSFTNLTGSTAVVVHDFSLGPVFRHTSISNNFTVNVTNLNLGSGSVTNISLLLVQGATPYMATALQIGGVGQTINWLNSTPPSGTANKIDIVNFSILNNSGTYTVIGQSATFG